VVTSSVSAGWAASETANVAGPETYATTDRAMKPDHNLGGQVRITRRARKQSGAALEAAIRRDMQGAMGAALDRAAFLGTGANGQPLGVIAGAATYGITSTAIGAAAS
jgi:HK97 family phage major capsid protein